MVYFKINGRIIETAQKGSFKMDTKDSNGTALNDGDSVQVIKDLKVKGSSKSLKRGKVFKNIRLTNKSEEIECRDGKTTLVLKTCFLKKA